MTVMPYYYQMIAPVCDVLGSGTHAYMLDTRALRAGVYVVRIAPQNATPMNTRIVVVK